MSSRREQAAKPGETVLVVEDEVLLHLSIGPNLRDCGYKVIEAGDEAVLVLKQSEPGIDALFADIETACAGSWRRGRPSGRRAGPKTDRGGEVPAATPLCR